jgi:hypothetical protein
VKFTFTHMKGSRAGTTQELTGDVVTVGRDPANQLSFDPVVDDKVSSFHASITVQGAQVLVTDVGSRNGTFVNGHKITAPTPIVPGTVVQFGDAGPTCAIMFSAAPAAPPPSAAAAPAAQGRATEKVAAPTAAKPVPAAAAPAAAAPAAAAAAAAPAAAKPAAPGAAPGKSKGCMVLGLIGGLLLACVLGTVAIALREKISQNIPPGIMTYVKKIPIVNKLFKVPAPPKLPGGVKVPNLGGGKTTEAPPPATETPTSTEKSTEAPPATNTDGR